MVNITNKQNTLRQAIATAIVKVSSQETLDAIMNKKLAKGDLFEFSRAAGLLAVKKTSDTIPDCHPIPIEFTTIHHHIEGLNIIVTVEVHTIYKTGVEVEAMHGAAITALTMYDMLKPIDKGVEIANIRLENKKGGKSDFRTEIPKNLKCAVIVCSDSISDGEAEDRSGKLIIEKLKEFQLKVNCYEIIPDDLSMIQNTAIQLNESGYDLILFTGGTGISPTDVTPDALLPLMDQPIPGIMETARQYGQQRSPYAMLSRGVAGLMGNTLIISMPGSPKGVIETMDSLFPQVLHIYKVKEGFKH